RQASWILQVIHPGSVKSKRGDSAAPLLVLLNSGKNPTRVVLAAHNSAAAEVVTAVSVLIRGTCIMLVSTAQGLGNSSLIRRKLIARGPCIRADTGQNHPCPRRRRRRDRRGCGRQHRSDSRGGQVWRLKLWPAPRSW